jgi:hypothetical protein
VGREGAQQRSLGRIGLLGLTLALCVVEHALQQ